MHEILSAKDNLTSVMLWGGSIAGSAGAFIATITAEGVGGLLIAGGGVLLTAYGLYNMGQNRALQQALERERVANDRLDAALAKLAECRARNIRLRAGLPEDDDDAPSDHPHTGRV